MLSSLTLHAAPECTIWALAGAVSEHMDTHTHTQKQAFYHADVHIYTQPQRERKHITYLVTSLRQKEGHCLVCMCNASVNIDDSGNITPASAETRPLLTCFTGVGQETFIGKCKHCSPLEGQKLDCLPITLKCLKNDNTSSLPLCNNSLEQESIDQIIKKHRGGEGIIKCQC